VRADIPGRVEGNPVFIYHEAFNDDKQEVAELKERYRRGKVGDSEVKKRLAQAINRFLDPIRGRRARYAAQPELIKEILVSGNRRMRKESEETMVLVREAIGLPSADYLPACGSRARPPGLIYC
jgi:tryptophanyl-tRNA synthetase